MLEFDFHNKNLLSNTICFFKSTCDQKVSVNGWGDHTS